jgi:conjugative transfer signal peptidase TraF
MTGHTQTLALIAVCALTCTIVAKPAPRLVWNASTSVPVGLYGVAPARTFTVATLVVVAPSEPLASFLANGGYLPRGVPLIKRVLALPGQSVCRNERHISVDGIEVGAALARDRFGRELPNWQGCRRIAQDEIFVMNPDEPASLDGRYFGPVSVSTIVGEAQPLWTSEEK